MSVLARLNLALFALLVLHALDHTLRQDASVPSALATVGLSGTVAAGISLGLALAGSRLAPMASAVIGLGTGAGFLAAHVVPHWSDRFSQFYGDIEVDAVSWLSVGVTMAVALVLGLRGLRELQRGRPTPAAARG